MDLEFERIYNEYSPLIYRIAFLYFRGRAIAEDVVQDTFVKLMTKAPHFRTEGHLKGWLITVTRNSCHNLAKRERRSVPLDENLPYLAHDNSVMHEIMRLPELDRTAIYLHYYEGYASKEIASFLGVTDGAVRARLKRARLALKINLE